MFAWREALVCAVVVILAALVIFSVFFLFAW